MLIRLEIKNFAVISNATFEPSNGLNVISGETGAGKSLIVDAIGLIMGAKANKSLIRSNESEAFVEAVFDISDIKIDSFFEMLSEAGLESEDDTLIISRKMSADGKSIARINGRTVVLSVLKEISSYLIDIHGQHDTQKIFDEKSHIVLLDSFGEEEIKPLSIAYTKLLNEYKDIILQIRNLSKSPDYFEKRKEYLNFAIKEIEEADFKTGEEKELLDKKHKYQLSRAFAEDLIFADESLNEETEYGSTLSNVSKALDSLNKVCALDDNYSELKNRLNNVYLELVEVSNDINKEASKLDFDPELMEANDKRIGLLYELQSKYGNTIEDINDFLRKAKEELNSLEDSKQLLKDLKSKRSLKETELLELSERLSSVRKEKGQILSGLIEKELKDLEIPNARFMVEFIRRPKEKFFSNHGIDDVCFMFSANLGQDMKKLSDIVSGGEASRIMLAIKSILSECDTIPTLIFDEIDTGVSGSASNSIAIKLKGIGKNHQVLCVSHTSQMAAAADNNYMLYKKSENNETNTYVQKLDSDTKVKEVSRLLSGSVTSESVELAKSLIDSFSLKN